MWEDMYASVTKDWLPVPSFPGRPTEELRCFEIVTKVNGQFYTCRVKEFQRDLELYPRLYGQILDQMVYNINCRITDTSPRRTS